MDRLPRLLCCLFVSLSLASAARAGTVHQEWEVSYQFKSPNCVRKLAVTINGQTPGHKKTYDDLAKGLNGIIVVAAKRGGGRDAEPFRQDGEHMVLLNDWWHKSTYEQATGLASVPIAWVGEPQSQLINGRVRFASSVTATQACNATHPECAAPVFAVMPGKTYRFRIVSVRSLSALNFESEDHNARLMACGKKPITVKADASGTTSSRRSPMGYQLYGAALVAAMVCLFLAAEHPVADQNLAADESTVVSRSAPAGTAPPPLPVGDGRTPSRSPPSTSLPSNADPPAPAYRNRSSANSSTSGEEDPSGPPASPHRPIVSPAVPWALPNVEGPLLTVVLALLGYNVAATAGILTEFERIVGTWSTAPKVVYGVLTVVGIALLAVGLMAAVWHARARNSSEVSVSSFCARAGAILSTSLLIVAFFCKLGRWARVAAVPSAAVIACIMAAVWIWGDEHAVANVVVCTCWGRILGQRRERELAAAGDDMV